MTAASRRAAAAALALTLLVAATACSEGPTSSAGVTGPGGDGTSSTVGETGATTAPVTTLDGVTTTTADPQVIRVEYLTDLIDGAYAGGGMAVRGWIVAIDGGRARVEGAEVVGDWWSGQAAPSEAAATFPLGRDWLEAALASLLEEGEIPALLLVTGDGVIDVAVLTDDLRSFRRDPGRDLPAVIGGGAWLGEAIDGGGLEVRVAPPIDPSRSLACQDRSRTAAVTYSPWDGGEVVGVIHFAEAALTARAAEASGWELESQAVQVATGHQWIDPLTGNFNGPYISDIQDQLARGIPPDEVEVHRTTSLYLDPGRLDWLEPGGELLLFADTETGRLLGWIDFYAYLDKTHEAETGWLEVMVPPEGDLGLYLRPLEGDLPMCTEDLPEPYIVIPRADLIAQRWVLAMDEGRAVGWRGEGSGG
jgi:hypothetical protein